MFTIFNSRLGKKIFEGNEKSLLEIFLFTDFKKRVLSCDPYVFHVVRIAQLWYILVIISTRYCQ